MGRLPAIMTALALSATSYISVSTGREAQASAASDAEAPGFLSGQHRGVDADPDGLAFLERIKRLEGKWTASMPNGVMTNVFRPIAFGSAMLHEEWLNGEQITATIFYVVGAELRADHFCDFKNQLRYAVKPTSDSAALTFVLREALNLDTQPRHFRSSTWHFLDATHLTQDWQIVEPGKEPRVVRMEFTRAT